MKSYSTLRNLFGTLVSNSSTANLTLGDELINDSIRRICTSMEWDFLEKTATSTTTAGTQFYALPFDYEKLIDVSITNGTTLYIPKECPSRIFWDTLNQQTTFRSDFPEWYFIYNSRLGFYPIPSTTSLTITYNYLRTIVDLNIADFSTGTVSATNGSTTLTGSGTSWTVPMAGRYIRLTATNTAASTGDNVWYEVASVSSGTSMVLSKAYNGTTTAGAAYVLGQMPIIPESYQDMPVIDAARVFFTTINPDATRAQLFKTRYDELFTKLVADHGTKTTDPAIHDTDHYYPINVNNFLSL